MDFAKYKRSRLLFPPKFLPLSSVPLADISRNRISIFLDDCKERIKVHRPDFRLKGRAAVLMIFVKLVREALQI